MDTNSTGSTMPKYNVLKTPRDVNTLLAFTPHDVKSLICGGHIQEACMSKYWYTYYTDLSMDTKLTVNSVNEFLDKINKGVIKYVENSYSYPANVQTLNAFIDNWSRKA